MLCSNCGEENSDTAKFCRVCGHRHSVPASEQIDEAIPTTKSEENVESATDPIGEPAPVPQTHIPPTPTAVPSDVPTAHFESTSIKDQDQQPTMAQPQQKHTTAQAPQAYQHSDSSNPEQPHMQLPANPNNVQPQSQTTPFSAPNQTQMQAAQPQMQPSPVAYTQTSQVVQPPYQPNLFIDARGLFITDVYFPGFNLNNIDPNQRENMKRHSLSKFPTWVAILLHNITLGLFSLIFYGVKHSHLPMIKSDDFSAGKAIGFMFIPFYNIYWIFKFWLRLSDRINFQFRLRNQPMPISKSFVWTALILNVTIGTIINIFTLGLGSIVTTGVLVSIMIGFIQHAINILVDLDMPHPSNIYSPTPLQQYPHQQ